MSDLSLAALVGVQIVQVTLCIVGAALLSFGCLRRRPAFAAAVWLAVLCKCATPPVWASPLGVFSWLHAEKPRAPTELPSWLEHVQAKPRPNDGIAAETPAVAEIASAKPIAWASKLPWMLVGVWAVGFVWTFGRAFRLRRRWLAAVVEECDPPTELVRAVAVRSKKLGMKPPCIVMVAADAGPAASGWFRPTVYLPLGADSRQLESMLVHELVHLRRRDPWLGALQAFVCAGYWFHPGVRWASDELSRCIEEACDAETVRELGCRPAEYAAALVALLERRVAPSSVPMVAGMTPARSVRRRLEAVMKSNPKQRGKTARGPWLAFAAATLIALPGAGLPPEPPRQQVEFVPNSPILPNPVTPPTAVAARPVKNPRPKPVEIKNFSHRGYDLKPAVDVLMKRCGLREDAATNAIANIALATAEHIGPRPIFAIAGQRLFAFAAEAQHEYMHNVIEGTIEVWSKDQVVIETEIWDVPKTSLDALQVEVVDKKGLTQNAFLDEPAYMELSKRLLSDKTANKLSAPKLTMIDGQQATMKIGTEHPLGGEPNKDGKPRTALIGLSLQLEPTISADGKYVSVKVRFEESNLARLVPQPDSDNGKALPEVPVVDSRVMETRVSVGLGVRVAIKTEPSKLLVLKCTKAPRPSADFNIDPPGDGRRQGRADSRMDRAMDLFRRRAKEGQPVVRVYPMSHHLREGAERPESQLHSLAAAFQQTFDLPGEAFQPFPAKQTMVVNVPVTIHDAFSRMLRDVDRRTDEDMKHFRIPPEAVHPAPVGN